MISPAALPSQAWCAKRQSSCRPDSEIPTNPPGRIVTFAGTLVNHVKAKRHDCRICSNIDPLIVMVKLVNGCTLAKVSKAGEESFSALSALAKARRNHDDFGIHEGGKGFAMTIQP